MMEIGERIRAMLAMERDQIDDVDVSDMVRDVLRPLEAATVDEIATIAGADYRDRQNIKRKASRWAEGFMRLAPRKRLTVLQAMASSVRREPVNDVDRSSQV